MIANRFSAAEQARLLAWTAASDPSGRELQFFAPTDRRWQTQFPYLHFPADYALLYEAAPAGYINPRTLLRAQNVVARQQGATIIDQQVTSVHSTAAGVEITTAAGDHYRADKVLIAGGAFTNFNGLLPQPLPLLLKTETMIWADVDTSTAARLQTMPGVGYNIDDPEIDDIYMAPPLLYPDGNYKIKMGCNTASELWPATLAEIQAWFQSGNSDSELPAMTRAIKSILPDVEFLKITSHRCIVTYTPSGYPTIDRAPGDPSGRLFVATGGNGSGAAGSDILGKLAAGLMHDGRWLAELPRAPFLAINEWGQSEKILTKAQARALEKIRQ